MGKSSFDVFGPKVGQKWSQNKGFPAFWKIYASNFCDFMNEITSS